MDEVSVAQFCSEASLPKKARGDLCSLVCLYSEMNAASVCHLLIIQKLPLLSSQCIYSPSWGSFEDMAGIQKCVCSWFWKLDHASLRCRGGKKRVDFIKERWEIKNAGFLMIRQNSSKTGRSFLSSFSLFRLGTFLESLPSSSI